MTNFSASGLSEKEVNARNENGQNNFFEEKTGKSTKAIFSDNILTLFNFLNLLIGIFIFAVGAYSNLFYLFIIFVNVSIGIIQEIHARNLVKKLAITTEQEIQVIRGGTRQTIASAHLVLDDLVVIGAGEQIPADLVVLSGTAQANESLLTGEADLVDKNAGATLLSGSFLTSGEVIAKVIHVGADNYANKLSLEAKKHKPLRSELINSIRKVSKFTSFVIIPLGIILFIQAYLFRDSGIKESVIVSSGALLGMLPKGLVLLISIALTTGVIKLAKKRLLVQDMYAIETLAHVDTLCLDKTGTITAGKMSVHQMHPLSEQYRQQLPTIIGSYLAQTTDNNATMQALKDYFPLSDHYQVTERAGFSSERKWGALYFPEIGSVYIGAPEKLLAKNLLPPEITTAQEAGYRVLLVALAPDTIFTDFSDQVPPLEPLALIEIADVIRENAKETLEYFSQQGIALKVISGDNPITVSKIAQRAGLPDYDRYIDLSTLDSEAKIREAAAAYTVFGRVTPQQKKLLVSELKGLDHTVAMTGDGVNDVLALREADVSIAMAAGDSAARQIANIVLLDSDFTALPDIVFEGRRVVNNVTKVAGIFFIKTIYSFLLSLICIATSTAFPFIPIQITLLDLAIEGYPSFFLSFENDKRQVRGSFLPTALATALPNALLVTANIIFVYLMQQRFAWSSIETTTLMYYLLVGISCMAVIKACLPFNPLRIFLAITTTIGVYTAAILFHRLLEIDILSPGLLGPFVLLMLLNILLRYLLSHWDISAFFHRLSKNQKKAAS